MKRIVLALALMMAVGSVAMASADSVKGTIIDTACYTADKHGAEQAGCTEMCLKMGVPPSLLTADGEVILLLPTADEGMDAFKAIEKLASKEVEVTGEVAERGGMKVIFVQKVKEAD